MDASSLSAWVGELDSKNTKLRLQALEGLGEQLGVPSGAAPTGELAHNFDENSWQQIVAPLVRTLRDNNYKVCRASLACLESLVARITENDARSLAARTAPGRNSTATVNSITPFLSLITPAVVECLGNSKTAVQEKGIDFLLAISDPAVAGARDTISSMEHHFGRHRNWRVRERLLAYLGRVTEVDSAGMNNIQQQQQQKRGVGGASLLAGLLADALNDSASQVRREALVAATRVVEMLTGNGGDDLLAQLEAKGVRRVALSALREAGGGGVTSGRRSGGESASSSTGAAAAGLLSPTTPAPPSSSRLGAAAAATTAHRTVSHGSVTASTIVSSGGRPLATVIRRKRQGVAGEAGSGGTSSVLTRAGSGAGVAEGGAPTPTGGAAAGRGAGSVGSGGGLADSPTAMIRGSPRGKALSGTGGKESAFSALEPLVAVTVYTERDVRREVEAVKTGLEHGSDWQRWVSAMRRLAGVALGGAGSEHPALLVGLVRASVHEMVGHKVSEIRSAVAREACRCVAVLARCLTDHFGALAELWLPELLRNTTRAVVVAAAGDEAARAIFGCTKDGFPRLLPYLIDTSKNKSAAIRRRCLDYAMLALARWSDAAFDRYALQTRDMVAAAVADADSSVRGTARRAYWVLRLRFPDLAQSVMSSLAPSMQRHVLREDEEFDAEAFVRAADAAAEDPQPALGEDPDDFGGGAHESGNDVAGDYVATTPVAADLSASGTSSSSSNVDNLQTSSSSAPAARRVHGTHHGGYSTSSVHQLSQRRPGSAIVPRESGGGGILGGGAVRSNRVKIDGVATAGGGVGGSARFLRPGGREPARRTRAGRATAQEGATDFAVEALSFGSGTAGDGVGGGGGDGDSQNRSASTALRVAGNVAVAGGGGGGDAPTAMMTASKPGAFRVPRGGGNGASETTRVLGGGGGGEALHQRSPATRVVAKRSPLVVPSAGIGEGEPQGFGGSAGLGGGVSKVGRGVQPSRPIGRQPPPPPPQQRLDTGAVGRRGTEAGERQEDGAPMRAVVTAPVVPDRRDVLRQMDGLADQAGVSHWAARTEALESLLHLLTAEGGGNDADAGAGAEGGRFVLESRPASRRLEVVIAERARDANFRVVTAALKLFAGLVRAHPALMAGHTTALLPSVFPNLADHKEPVRHAANDALNACRAVYSPHQLCSSLCPRILELPPGRARTGLLEFLAVLVPHSASFLLHEHHSTGGGGGGGNGAGHLHSLTQRVAAALVQAPPPSNWDGRLGEDGPTSAGSAASAAIRLLTALYRLDRDALATASASLPPESAAAVRRALSFFRSPSSSPARKAELAVGVSSPTGAEQGESGAITIANGGSTGASGDHSPAAFAGEEEGEEYGVVRAAVGTPMDGGVRTEFAVAVGSMSGDGTERLSSILPPQFETPQPPAAAASSPSKGRSALSSTPGSAFLFKDGDEGCGRLEAVSASFTPPQQQYKHKHKPHRQPLAPITLPDSNRQPVVRGGFVPAGCGENDKRPPAIPSPKKFVTEAPSTVAAARTPLNLTMATATTEAQKAAEAVVVAGRLITGLSPGARSHKKVEALSSLRGLADGEGAGGRPDFWPKYFDQVLMLLLEGAAADGAGDGTRSMGGGGRQGGAFSSPARRRSLLRTKHLQGVRCLVARRGELFRASTEMVVSRLVEIGGGGGGGGDTCLGVRCEAEACLSDLVGVLDPARYLAVLTPLLAFVPDGAARGVTTGRSVRGGEDELKENAIEGPRGVLAQCVALGALRALTPQLSSPGLLGALRAGPLLAGLEAALGGRDLEARKRVVLAFVEMYQVLEEALLPFLANFPTSRLKLITMYIEQRRAKENAPRRTAAATAGDRSNETHLV